MRRTAFSIYLLVLTGCWPRPTGIVDEPLPVIEAPVPLKQVVAQAPPPVSPYQARPTPPEPAKSTAPELARSTPPEPAKSTPPELARSTPPELAKSTPPQLARSTPPELPAQHVAPDPQPPPPPRDLPPPVQQVTHALPVKEVPAQPASRSPEPRRFKDPAVVDALRCLLEKRPADAVVPLEKLDKSTQDLLLRFLPLIARLNDGSLEKSDPEELALVASQLEEVIRTLRPRSALLIEQMCFCRRIETYGQYDPLPPDYRFKPGEMVLVYVELENLSSRLVNGLYETHLASSVQIEDAQERTVWRQDLKDRDRPDRSRSQRSDYCNGYRFCIPENIPPGDYRLLVRVADLHAPERKPAERSLPLRVTTRPLGRPLAESAGNR